MGNAITGQPTPLGDRDRVAVATAAAWLDAAVEPLCPETVVLAKIVGRVLVDDIRAADDIPPYDRAAIDGLAVRAADTLGAGAYNPLSFRLVAAIDDLSAFEAAGVVADGRLPRGADAVLAPEQVSIGHGVCEIIEPVAPGTDIERAGSHAARGAVVLPAGRRLRPHDLGVLAAAGAAQASVVRRPAVRLLLTGDTSTRNAAMLAALVRRDGGMPAEIHCADRSIQALCAALAAAGADLVLVVADGGRGVDARTEAAIGEVGALAIRSVALTPGEFTGLGRAGPATPVVLLPGPVAACLWGYEILAGRAVRRLGGRDPALPFRSIRSRTVGKIVSALGVTEICPVRCRDGGVAPLAAFAGAGPMAAADADGFVIVPEGSEGFPDGGPVTAYLYDGHDAIGHDAVGHDDWPD